MGRHALESDLAREFGVATAAVYDRLYELCREKAERNADSHDGLFWARIPSKDFPRAFPFPSSNTVVRSLGKLRDEGLAIVGHYGKEASHGTGSPLANWYALT